MVYDSEGQAPLFIQLPGRDATDAASCRPQKYEDIAALAKQMRRKVEDTLALSEGNDPYYAGVPGRRLKAEWFAALWEQYGTEGAHLRRMHYRLVSQPVQILKPDGMPYLNTLKDWDLLVKASGSARCLGLVQGDVLTDARNPEAVSHTWWTGEPDERGPSLSWPEYGAFGSFPTLPAFYTDFSVNLITPSVEGYDYSQRAQPYHLEIWVEKSTMDDILTPICSRYRAVQQQVIGFASITRAIECLKRIAHAGKPARIFYLSDYDPAGKAMAPAMARQMEYWRATYAPGADIKLTQLVLTKAQKDRYHLPTTPIKANDRRKGNFEKAHGEGAVELDALEAVVPGVLRSIVEEALRPYVDTTIANAIADQRTQVEDDVEAAWHDATEGPRHAIARIEQDIQAVLADFAEEYEALRARVAAAVAPYREQIATEMSELADIQETFTHPLPPVQSSALEVPEHDERWLFDSRRDYLTQLAFYKRNKSGDTQEEEEDPMTKPTGRPRGRPKSREYTSVGARIPKPLGDWVDAQCSARQQTVSDVVREALTMLCRAVEEATKQCGQGHTYAASRRECPTCVTERKRRERQRRKEPLRE